VALLLLALTSGTLIGALTATFATALTAPDNTPDTATFAAAYTTLTAAFTATTFPAQCAGAFTAATFATCGASAFTTAARLTTTTRLTTATGSLTATAGLAALTLLLFLPVSAGAAKRKRKGNQQLLSTALGDGYLDELSAPPAPTIPLLFSSHNFTSSRYKKNLTWILPTGVTRGAMSFLIASVKDLRSVTDAWGSWHETR
jgi:hypothetical protein